jgi:hypothetical protein
MDCLVQMEQTLEQVHRNVQTALIDLEKKPCRASSVFPYGCGTRMPEQFDAIIHVDETRPVEPLVRTSLWETGGEEAPETYPFAV